LLAEHGVRHVFGVPGGQTLALYDAILDRDPDLRHVLVRDERSAAYAADGYARVTGRAGVCDATVGPGAAKLPSGLAEALGASVPVVALVSDLPARLAPHRYRSAASQALDQAALLAPVTKWHATVPDAATLPALVRQAFREATTGRPGPVALFLPQDVLDGPVPDHVAPQRSAGGSGPPGGSGPTRCSGPTGGSRGSPPRASTASPRANTARFGSFPAFRPPPDPQDVAAAVAVLRAAQRPFVLAGDGALGYAAGELATVAELGLPVTVIVLNNRSLGWIRWYRRITFGRGWEGEDFSDVPFADVARAFGLAGERVTEPARLAAALRTALGSPGPALLDVVTEPWQTPITAHRDALRDGATTGYGG
jgi:thiamine pyrophosphate-dependent acetolactate synthase large subunit-like protein